MLTFLSFGTTAKYQVIIETKEIDYPAVTICNLNAFDPSTNEKSGIYLKEKLKENRIPPEIQLNDSDTAIKNVTITSTLLKAIAMSETNFACYNITRKDLGFSMESMLISCFYNDIQCNASDFLLVYTFDYGNCYTFNNKNGSLKKTRKSGPGSGLELELFVGKEGRYRSINILNFHSKK